MFHSLVLLSTVKSINYNLQRQIVTNLHIHVLQNLGLEVCADILVGDAMMRGVSGGQKKRVTTGIKSYNIISVMIFTYI
jgi:hypothetical protein